MSLSTILRTLASLALLLTISGLYRVDVRGWRQTELAAASEARSIEAAVVVEETHTGSEPMVAQDDHFDQGPLAMVVPEEPDWLLPGARGAQAP